MSVERLTVYAGGGALPAGASQIGAQLVDAGKLTVEDAERVLRLQKEKGLRFGEAAVKLGLVTQADIQQVLSRQFDYSYLLPGDDSVLPDVVAAHAPFSRQVEALRALRSQLLLRWFVPNESARRFLSVVSLQRNEGRSYLAANLAVVFSQLGERTLLIDGDLRHPRQHELFKLDNRDGLSAILSGRADLSSVQRVAGMVDLSVMVGGARPPNPLELLQRPSCKAMLEAAGQAYDVVIVDTPAAELGSDAQTLAARTGGALLVARKHQSSLGMLEALKDELSATGTQVVGAVLNNH